MTLTYKGISRKGNKRKSGLLMFNPHFSVIQDGLVVDMRNGNVWKI